MTVPAGTTLYYNGNQYNEGDTVPKDAESLIPAVASPKSSKPTASTDSASS